MRFALASAAVLAGAGLLFVRQQRGGDTRAIAEPPKATLGAAFVAANSTTLDKRESGLRVRQSRFTAGAAGFEAEGVKLSRAGELSYSGQQSGAEVTAKLIGASVLEGGKPVRTMTPSDAPEAVVDGSSLRYARTFPGIDLEYRYDGKTVEELFHLDATLKAELASTRRDLEITTLLPGVSRAKGALIESRLPPIDDTGSDVPAMYPARFHTDSDLVLAVNTDRFHLPKAIARDAGGKQRVLERHFAWTDEGLQVGVRLPGAWLAETNGEVVIDPTIVDQGREIQIRTWNERTVVKDSTGRMHKVYMGVARGRWRAMYTSGTGLTWDPPVEIDNRDSPGERTHYTPSIAIDATDTLHVIWADYGPLWENRASRGRYSNSDDDWGHRVHYARCPNRCTGRVWSWRGVTGGQQIRPCFCVHQAYEHIAVDQGNVAHLSWEEQDQRDPANVTQGITPSYRHVYGTITDDGAFVQGPDIPRTTGNLNPPTYHHTQLIMDNGGAMYSIAADYHNNYDIKLFQLSAGSWIERANLQVLAAGCTDGRMHNHSLQATFDNQNFLHAAWQGYDHSCRQRWHPVYGRYNPATNTWDRAGEINRPAESAHPHLTFATLTVDDARTVHVMWRSEQDPEQPVEYAARPDGGAWSATRIAFDYPYPETGVQLRPRLSWPNGPNQTVPAGAIDVFLVLYNGELRYQSTGAPVEPPALISPANHAYVNTAATRFEWRRIAADTGANMTYVWEMSTTPAFRATGLCTFTGNATSYTTPGVPCNLVDATYYYWRVKARNGFGDGPYSAIREVGADTAQPNTFNLIAPANAADPQTRTPHFEWQANGDPGP